uniref:RING-box protein 2 n=1 Tax=Salmo salar TaxID=8030 RepID=B9ELJ5_SALSA|nr:RING-box protein 2 [Salmo salar]
MAEMEDGEEPSVIHSHSSTSGSKSSSDKMFSLKKWNAVAMWSWDVECDTCAICRVQVWTGDRTVYCDLLCTCVCMPLSFLRC